MNGLTNNLCAKILFLLKIYTLNRNNDIFIWLKHKSGTRHHVASNTLSSTTGIASYCWLPILHNVQHAKHHRFLFTKTIPLLREYEK